MLGEQMSHATQNNTVSNPIWHFHGNVFYNDTIIRLVTFKLTSNAFRALQMLFF